MIADGQQRCARLPPRPSVQLDYDQHHTDGDDDEQYVGQGQPHDAGTGVRSPQLAQATSTPSLEPW